MGTRNSKKSFIMYDDYAEHFALLSAEDTQALMTAIFRYNRDGAVLGMSPTARMAFSFIKSNMDRDQESYQRVVDRNTTNGRKGGRPVKLNDKEKPTGLSGNPSEPKEPDTDIDTVTENDTETKTPPAPQGERYTKEFDEWWKLYPKKSGKGAAFKAFQRAKKKNPVSKLMAAVKAHAQNWIDTSKEAQYIPNPATWLNQSRFDDELEMPTFDQKPVDTSHPVQILKPDGTILAKTYPSYDACREVMNRKNYVYDGQRKMWVPRGKTNIPQNGGKVDINDRINSLADGMKI